MLPDFTNFSLKKIKVMIGSYQKDQNSEILSLLLAKFDKYILYVLYEMKKSYSYLKNEEMQELYHTGIIGFCKGVKAFKLYLDVSMILLVIKAYIKSEIKQTYAYKNKEMNCSLPFISVTPDSSLLNKDAFLLKEIIFSSPEITDREKEIIKLRFFEDMDVKDIAKALNTKDITMFKQLSKLLIRIKKMVTAEEVNSEANLKKNG